MKLLSIGMIAALPLLACFYILQQKKAALNALTELQILIDYVREEVRYAVREKGEIFKNAKNLPIRDSAICGLFVLNGAPLFLTETQKNGTALKPPDLKLLTDFYNTLGNSDRTGTLKHCQYYGYLAEKQRQTLAAEYRQKKKLYLSLCLALSALIFILLC